ncbi:MAG: hypothetical protein DU489_16240 [Nitrosomonas sp.]|uniref:hypothetical protein n=1 Tax=Nitrosomonas sp. TaxID=42353 RepID=UPI0032EAFAD9
MYDPDTDTFELEQDKPLVLLLGNIAHEGVLSMLKTSDRQYKQKRLRSKPGNWQNIVEYFDTFEISSVLIKLDPYAISLMASENYKEVSNQLFQRIAQKPNMVFVYEDLLAGEVNSDEWKPFHGTPSKEDLNKVLEIIEHLELEIMPYKRNAQVTVLAESFLQDTEANLLFRLYVPSGRMWSNETDRLLQLFREYLSNVGHISVRLDQQRTDKGIIYEFHGGDYKGENGLSKEFAEFTQFLDLCVRDQSAAETILANKSVDAKKVSEILTRYSKEAKRLHVDLKHERERKILGIQQRLESELIDEIAGDVDWNAISQLVELTVPSIRGTGASLMIGNPSHGFEAHNKANITLNINPQIIATVNGIVAQEINGNQNFGIQGQELLELVQKYGETKASELTSAVCEIEDKNVPKPDRLKAGQKLKKFLIEVARKGGDVATGVLQKYIENQLGL